MKHLRTFDKHCRKSMPQLRFSTEINRWPSGSLHLKGLPNSAKGPKPSNGGKKKSSANGSKRNQQSLPNPPPNQTGHAIDGPAEVEGMARAVRRGKEPAGCTRNGSAGEQAAPPEGQLVIPTVAVMGTSRGTG